MIKTILHLCADTGSDSIPYVNAGYNVIKIGKPIGVENYNPPENVFGIIANPVCTDFSFANILHRPDIANLDMLQHVKRIIAQANPKFWVIENPASGKMKEILGEPVFTYEPWHFGSPWTKKTALWGNFNHPERFYDKWEDVPKLEGLYTRPNRPKPSLAFMHKSHCKFIPEFSIFNPQTDMEFRSLCSQKFAQAFFEVNK